MNSTIRVLIISMDERQTSLIQSYLEVDRMFSCSNLTNFDDTELNAKQLKRYFCSTKVDIIILSDSCKQISILQFIKILKQSEIFTPILVISKRNEPSFAVEVIKAGGENFLVEEQLSSDKLIHAVYSAMQTREENKKLEVIQLENQKLLKAIEQSPVSIMMTKAETNKIEYANPMFSLLTGYSHTEVKGKQPSILKSGMKSKADYQELWDTILSGKTWKGEFANRKKDGSFYYVSAVISPVKINEKEITHYIGIHEDITQRKIAEEQLKDYAKMLEKKSNELEKAYQLMDNHIRRARRLHRHFFPISFPTVEGIKIDAFYKAAHKIGSDYYNFHHLKDQLIVYIVDVSGSGIDGAFINIFIRQKINRYLYMEDHPENISPKKMLDFLAKHFVEEKFPEEYFICMYVAVLDLKTKNLTYCNAGIQVPPIVVNNNCITTLTLGGLPISSAIPIELLSYEEESLVFSEDTTILFSTDGIVESEMNGEVYGLERLQNLVLNHGYLPPHELKKAINHDIAPMFEKESSHDDVTYVILQHASKSIDEKSFLINSDCFDVEVISEELIAWLECYCPDVNSILVGFNEMIYNAIEHGNKFDLSKKVEIKAIIEKRYLLITIEDEGEGFDWKTRMKRKFDITNFEERGRGIIFTKASFDFITYNPKGNIVYLYKKISCDCANQKLIKKD